MKKEGVVVVGVLLVLFIMLFLVPTVQGACFIKTFSEQVSGSTRDCSIDWWESDCDEKGGRHVDRPWGDNDCCYLPTTDTVIRNQCYTRGAPFNQDDNRRGDRICLITANNHDGSCVTAEEAGDYRCTIDGREVSITREEFDKLDEGTKSKCSPGILKYDGTFEEIVVIERIDLSDPVSNAAQCDPDRVVCGAEEKKDDAPEKAGLDAIQCCKLKDATVTAPVTRLIEFPPKNDPKQQNERRAQCPVENPVNPVLCGVSVKDGDFDQMQCCSVKIGEQPIPIKTENPRIILIKDEETEKLCDADEFACGFVQAKARVNWQDEFIDAPGGILCCKDLTAAPQKRRATEAAEDGDNDGVLNRDDECRDTPAGESVITLEQAERENVGSVGCGITNLNADTHRFICEELTSGTWLTRKQGNENILFDPAGVCCGGEKTGGTAKVESFAKQGQDVAQACLRNEPLASPARGGRNLLFPLIKPIAGGQSNTFLVSAIYTPPSLQIGTNKPSYEFEQGVLVLHPLRNAVMKEVIIPTGSAGTVLEFEAQISKGDELRVELLVDMPFPLADLAHQTAFVGMGAGFFRYRISLPALKLKKISFISKGDKDIRIKNEQIYSSMARRVLHVNGEFFSCGMANDERESFSRTEPASEQPAGALIPGRNNVLPSCKPEDKKEGFYCSGEGIWKRGAERNSEKLVPPSNLLREVGISQAFQKFADGDCCAASECWDGAACVASGLTPRFQSAGNQKGLFCNKGTWEIGDLKTNQFGNGKFLCPGSSCAYKTERGHTCKDNGFTGSADSGEVGEDIFCDAGEWTSRPAKMAQILTTKIGGMGSRYSLYCGAPGDVLSRPDFSSALPGETTPFLQNGGAAYACVLEFNTHAWRDAVFKGPLSELPIQSQNVIVALALAQNNSIITAPDEQSALLPALDAAFGQQDTFGGTNVFTHCYGAFKYQDDPGSVFVRKPDDFYGCTGIWEEPLMNYGGKMLPPSREAKLWYNRRLNTLLYSPKPFRFTR